MTPAWRAGFTTRDAIGATLIAGDALLIGVWLRWLAAVAQPGVRPPGTGTVVVTALLAWAALRGLARRWGHRPALLTLATLAGAGLTAAYFARRLLYVGAVPGFGWLDDFLRQAVWDTIGMTSVTLVVGTAIVIWWRAVRSATGGWGPRAVGRHVAGWVIGFSALAVAVAVTRPVDLSFGLSGLAIAAMTCLALAHLQDARAGTKDPGATTAWYLQLAGVIVLVLVVSAAVAAVASVESGERMLAILSPLPEVITRLILVLLVLVVEAIWFVIQPVAAWIAQGLREGVPLLGDRQMVDPPAEPLSAAEIAAATPLWLQWALRGMVTIAILVAVTAWLRRAVGRSDDAEPDDPAMERRIEWSTARAFQDLTRGVRSAVRNLGDAMRFRGGSGPAGVRGVYRRFLADTAAKGRPRQAATTPGEHRRDAYELWPEAQAPVDALTRLYERARYGPQGEAQGETSAAQEAWRRIRRSEAGDGGDGAGL